MESLQKDAGTPPHFRLLLPTLAPSRRRAVTGTSVVVTTRGAPGEEGVEAGDAAQGPAVPRTGPGERVQIGPGFVSVHVFPAVTCRGQRSPGCYDEQRGGSGGLGAALCGF